MKRLFPVHRIIPLLAAAVLASSPARGEITERNIRFVEYPGFREAHSTWKSIGYSSRHDKVFIGVTDHRGKVGLYEYEVPSGRMRLLGFIAELANLREYQWQGKVHSEIIEGPDGCMYFSTDGGESREEYLMNHPHGYSGGFFFKWDPVLERLTCLGQGLEYESIKDIAVDRVGGLIYGVSYPQVHLLVYDPRENLLRDLGRMGSAHVPRTVFSDRWGNGYYVDWRQRLVKYERETGRLLFSSDSLPAFDGTPAPMIITGVPTYAVDSSQGVIYLITYGNMICAFRPQKTGIGPVEALGPTWDSPELPPSGYSPNSAFAGNGKLYYFIGGHGRYMVRDTTVLMEFDPAAGTRRPVLRFPIDVISEATGADVRDSRGNLYFAGRRRSLTAEDMGESGASRPFMIIFNPERNLK
ncbi:MAG: hypothetical protein JXQ83_13705 [Candidatus Glassbacteria bacterium]|nr:hypothetical protein [Candidatus Glassbacteria bacterium]